MDFNYRTITRLMGRIMLILAAAMTLPTITAILYDEKSCLNAFGNVLIPLFIFGLFFSHGIKRKDTDLNLRDGFLIAAVTWLFMSAISAIPFVISGTIPKFIDAFFEMCSGFSTTGATILTDIEALLKSMLMWRSFSHWIGGMGIVVFAIALLPTLGISGQNIVEAETPGPTLSKVTPKMSNTARSLYIIYVSLTLAETLLLMVGDMNLFDALTHSFGTIGTGGFSNYNDSIAHFHSPYIEIIITIFMLASGVNFNLYYISIMQRKQLILKDQEAKLYFSFFGVVTILITLWLFFSHTYSSIIRAFRYAAFHTASLLTTTGFATTDYDLWPAFCTMMLLTLYFIGGSSSSTAGGIKSIRILVLLKMIHRSIFVRLHPNALANIKVNKRIISIDTIQEICSFVFLYVTSIFVITLIVSLDNFDFVTSFSSVATCIGNVGPGFNKVGPSMNFHMFSDGIKFVLSLTMIMGRLELFTFLMLFNKRFWNPNK